MGFTKRYFSKELILKHIEINYPLSKYFNVDSLMFVDDVAHQAYKLFIEGSSDSDIKQFLLEHNKPLIEQN